MLTEELLKAYFVEPSKLPKHPFYERSVVITTKLEAHSKGKFPKEIIDIARPNETAEQKKYRKDVFTPVTKTYFSKVVSTIAKIGRAEDWKIEMPEQGGVAEGETLKDYTTESFPNFDSLVNWFFSLQLREMCDDPNGVIAVFPYPKKDPANDSEYLRPFPFWFESTQVINYIEGELAVLRSGEKSYVNSGKNQVKEGIIYYVFDNNSWAKCTQVGEKSEYRFVSEIQDHWIGHVPCFKIGGIIEEFENGEMLYDSFIGDCLPYWDEALRRHSDLQVQMVLHVHSEKWEIEDSQCKTCSGTGKVKSTFMGSGGALATCGTCQGSGGGTTRSPFNVKLIKPATKTGISDTVSIPTPPMDYIRKPIEETQFIHDQVNENITNGLAAINMEFLMNQPQINSGVSKIMDRQEMNSFFYMIARHIVKNIFDPVYYYTAKWRYGLNYSEKELMDVLPEINIPSDFDILTQDVIAQRLVSAKTAGVSQSLMSNLQIQYAKKEFGDDSDQVEMLGIALNLDPLPGKTEDEKMTILSNKGTTLENYILSSNIVPFINRAYSENEDFCDMEYSEQLDILNKYVDEIMGVSQSNVIPLVGADGQPQGSDINTPVDIEAEAKARLKGSVGGVQGILAIQASVAQGITSMDSAIVTLQEIYGFDPATSKKMLGAIKKPSTTGAPTPADKKPRPRIKA